MPVAPLAAPLAAPDTTSSLATRLVSLIALAVAVGAFVVGLGTLIGEVRQVRVGDVVGALRSVGPARMGVAALLTVLAYVALCGYDALALTYVARRPSIGRVAFASGVAYGLSQMLGFPVATGGAVRFRLWRVWGLSPAEIARATGFVGATFAIGIATVAGAALLLAPNETLDALHVPAVATRLAGGALAGAVAIYIAWSVARGGQSLRLGRWTLAVPAPRLVAAQVVVAAVDWAIAGAVLRALLPASPGLGFLGFLGIFVVAQVAGLVSHVPGGLGVFESVTVALLRPFAPPVQVLGALLAYRIVYYLLPFGLALLALATYEVRARRARLAEAAASATAFLRWWLPAVLPMALGVTTFLAGTVLLVSGATPSLPGRVAALGDVVPLGFSEVSHLVGGVAGAMLLVLAWGLARRLDAAWGLTVALLGVGIAASLLKGFDWEEALLLAGVLAVVLPARRAFFRKAALTAEPITPGWVAAMVTVLAASVWIGFASYRHVAYSHDLWWRFAERADASRFLRATAGALGVLLTAALLRIRHAAAAPALPDLAALDRAHAVARRSSGTVANLALLGDKALLFSACGDAFIQYGVGGRSWVALGDPVGPRAARAELAWRFRQEADRNGGWTVFYQVGTENLPLYLDLGLTLRKLGEEAHVPLDTFSLDGGARRGLRRVVKDVQQTGATFEVVPPEAVPALLPALRAVSDAWLATKATREKGFSLGRFDERYLARLPVAVVRAAGGDVVAFANVWSSDAREELSVDLMRYTPDAPRSVMEYLFVQIMLWGRTHGYRTFNLGMAPLAGLEHRPLASRWSRLGALVYRHGEHFYNFRGLRAYKEKFDPVWEPRYLAAPGGLALPRVLANVTALIAGGLTGAVRR